MTERATIVLRPKRPRIVASAEEWRELRAALWARSGGRCEEIVDGIRCMRSAQDAAHIKARSQGGDDVLANLRALCRVHHAAEHGIRVIVPEPRRG